MSEFLNFQTVHYVHCKLDRYLFCIYFMSSKLVFFRTNFQYLYIIIFLFMMCRGGPETSKRNNKEMYTVDNEKQEMNSAGDAR